jgi:hypothetical protein
MASRFPNQIWLAGLRPDPVTFFVVPCRPGRVIAYAA